jgi:4-hydroxy-tetrahydrodipicolinate synthase
MTTQFRGAYTALVTPFKNGKVDEDAYRAFIDWQIEQGIDGVVAVGTTGESATLTHHEHEEVIRICVEHVKGRVPVIAGTGGNDTHEAITLTKYAKKVGADASLQVTPYYNKPTQEGLIAHYKAIAKAAPLPMIVYNVPGRTSVNLLPKTLARLVRECPEVVAVKEATGDLKQVSQVVKDCGPDFQVISGDDFTVLPLLAVGGCGVISVVSNVAPADMAALCKAAFDGKWDEAKKLHYKLWPLNIAMFLETNPVPVKSALALMGMMSADLRLPLVPMLPENQAALEKILKEAKLI